VESLVQHDEYMLLADYASYIECQERVSKVYNDPAQWAKMSILNVANMGKFSTDRTIREYADEIWGLTRSGVPTRETAPDEPPNSSDRQISAR
jgi:starch phosphorylase